MTAFQIDTGVDPMRGAWRVNKVEIIMDAARDLVGDHADNAEYHAAVARLVHQDVLSPRKPETARSHMLALWPLVAAMATEAPASFDWLIAEFAEHLSGFR